MRSSQVSLNVPMFFLLTMLSRHKTFSKDWDRQGTRGVLPAPTSCLKVKILVHAPDIYTNLLNIAFQVP